MKLYQNYVAQDGIAAADTYSARPGYSEHQSGLVVDIDNGKVPYTSFETTKEYTWMVDHAYQFGFILRYPKGTDAITGYQFEAWHYRYVGKEIALKIKNTHLTFDEYYARYLDSELQFNFDKAIILSISSSVAILFLCIILQLLQR